MRRPCSKIITHYITLACDYYMEWNRNVHWSRARKIWIFWSKHRILNLKLVKNFQKTSVFRQNFEVWCFHQSSNLTSVESFWRVCQGKLLWVRWTIQPGQRLAIRPERNLMCIEVTRYARLKERWMVSHNISEGGVHVMIVGGFFRPLAVFQLIIHATPRCYFG